MIFLFAFLATVYVLCAALLILLLATLFQRDRIHVSDNLGEQVQDPLSRKSVLGAQNLPRHSRIAPGRGR
jgi:hypothetical protein